MSRHLAAALTDSKRLQLIAEAVRYCQRVEAIGMPSACYTKVVREPIYFLWACRLVGRNKADRAQFRSEAAVGLKYGKVKLVFDHAIPFRYTQKALLQLREVSTETVRDVLEKFRAIQVLITKEEDRKLNRAGLKSAMPPDWNGTDPLARYKAAGIALLED